MNMLARESQILELFPHTRSHWELPFPTLLERSIFQPEGNSPQAPFGIDTCGLKCGKDYWCLKKVTLELRSCVELSLQCSSARFSWAWEGLPPLKCLRRWCELRTRAFFYFLFSFTLDLLLHLGILGIIFQRLLALVVVGGDHGASKTKNNPWQNRSKWKRDKNTIYGPRGIRLII